MDIGRYPGSALHRVILGEGLPVKAAICGAGISGLSAAAFLARRGWQVVVVEQATGPRPQGYMIDFFGPGWRAADELGILPGSANLATQSSECGLR